MSGLVESRAYDKNTNKFLFMFSWYSIQIEIIIGIHDNNSYFTHNIIIRLTCNKTNSLGPTTLCK